MKVFIILISLITASCRTTTSTPSIVYFNQKAFLYNFDSINQKIRSDLYLERNLNLSQIELKDYELKLNTYNSDVAKVLKKDLSEFELKLHHGFKNTFIICAYSTRLSFSACDDARCSNVENYKSSPSDETETLRTGLPKAKCGGI